MTETRHTTPKEIDTNVTIRPAQPADVEAMLALFADEVAAGRMLPRDSNRVRTDIDDWLAATDGAGRIVGCVSLVRFNHTLCEIRSLAVHPDLRGNGLGSRLVRAAVGLAEERGFSQVLTLTRAAPFFEGLGFRRDTVLNYPEKVWTDCAPCPFKDACDEIALVYFIGNSQAHRGNGRHGPTGS